MVESEMINVSTAMRSRKDRANLMLLSRFLKPEQLSDLGRYWDDVLEESRVSVVERLLDQGLIVPCTPEVKLNYKLKLSDLKSMLKAKGIKRTGNKAMLISNLIEHDPARRWRIFQCSDAGRVLALEYEEACEYERKVAESDVLAFLMQRDFRNASLRRYDFASKQVRWNGGGFSVLLKFHLDPNNGLGFTTTTSDTQATITKHNPENDVQTLEFIFSGWPAILNTVPHDLRDALRLGAAMMELFGARTAMQWFEEVPKTNSHFDLDTVIRMICFYGRHQQEMQEYKRMGVRRVTIIGGEDEESCPHCAAISGKKFPIGNAPELPLAECTSECGCRCIASVC